MISGNIQPILLLVAGIALLFLGYKLQKWMVILGWFLLGFYLGGIVGAKFVEGTVLLLVELGIGLILATCGWKLQKLALFVAISYYAYSVLLPYNISFFDVALYNTVTVIGIAVIIGIISVRFIKPIMILVTCFYGATLIRDNLPVFVSLSDNIMTYGYYGLIVLGAIIQGSTS